MSKLDLDPIKNLEDTENSSNEISDKNLEENKEEYTEVEEKYTEENSSVDEDKEYIEREAAFEEDSSLMDSLLSDVNDLENDLGIVSEEDNLSTSLEEENSKEEDLQTEYEGEFTPANEEFESNEESFIEEDEPFKTESEYNGEIDEPYQDEEPFQYQEDEGELDDDPDNYYNDAEISERRKKAKRSSSNLPLKILVGVVAIGVIVGLAFGARYVMNNSDKLFKKGNTQEENKQIETVNPSSDVIEDNTTPTPEKEETVSPGLDIDSEVKDEEKVEDNSEKVSSFLQTFTGYVVDINNKEIYVSDKLTSEQEALLKSDFDSYIAGTNTMVYIPENQYNELMGISNEETTTEADGPIIIGGDTQEQTQSSTSSDDKYYHIGETCETTGQIGMKAIKLTDLSSEYEACPDCGSEIGQTNQSAIDYDYSLNADLAAIIYKKFNIDAETLPVWTTIGSKVTISYIQNEETLLNDVIEISRAKNNVSENTGDSSTTEASPDDVDDYRISSTNIFGADFDAIVATIEDRRRGETKREGNVLDDELSLSGAATKDTISADLNLGACEYVWIQIVWKKNKETPSIPDIEDVTVELQTPQGSLINESNIDGYGRKWINKKVINYVLKNPKVGNWKVMFTKNIGDYLGDVTIQAAPMTGFLQIKKAAAKYTEGMLKVIWQATGIVDDNCIVQIYARNGDTDILLYAGNTIDDNVHTVDMVDIDTAKIAGNIYDIVIKVQDIDVSAGTPKKVTYKFITDEYIVPNVEIPAK